MATSGAIAAAEPSGRAVLALAVDGTDAIIRTDGERLFRQGDGGGAWEQLARPDGAIPRRITAIAVSGQAPHTLYVGGPGLGVLRSSDGGRTWTAKRDGLPSDDVAALTAHADQPDTIYAYVTGKGAFRSDDRGDHWRLMDAGPRYAMVQFVHSNMPGSMQTGWLFAATSNGVSRSMDCFCGWRDAGSIGQAATAVAYDPQTPQRVYAATANGLLVSDNGGEQWAAMRSPARITALVATRRGALVAGDAAGVLYRSTDLGVTWQALGD